MNFRRRRRIKEVFREDTEMFRRNTPDMEAVLRRFSIHLTAEMVRKATCFGKETECMLISRM